MRQQFEKRRDIIITPTLQICFLRKETVLRGSAKYNLSLTQYTCAWPMKKELSDTSNNMYFIKSD